MSTLLLLTLLAAAPKSPTKAPAPPPPPPPVQALQAQAGQAAPADQPAAQATYFAQPKQAKNYAQNAGPQAESGDVNMARMGLLLLVIGALGLGYWFFKKRRLPFTGSALIHKVAHSQIVPGQGVALVEVDGRMLVLGTGQGGIRLLYHYPVDNSDDLTEPDFSESMNSDEANELRRRLRTLGQQEEVNPGLELRA